MASIFADHLLHKKHVVPASGGYTKMRFPFDEEVFEEEQRLDVRSCDERLAAVVVVRGGKRRGMEDTVWWRKKNRSRVAFSSMFSLQGG